MMTIQSEFPLWLLQATAIKDNERIINHQKFNELHVLHTNREKELITILIARLSLRDIKPLMYEFDKIVNSIDIKWIIRTAIYNC